MSTKVVLFGLDGATYTVLDDLVRRGVMPYLGSFMERGVRASLMSTIPHLTPPAWTTLVTGRSPGVHGVTNFLQYQSQDSPYVRVISSREICCETIWSMVGRSGGRAGSLNFIAHAPAQKVDGYTLPGWVPWRWVKKHSYPADLVSRLQTDLTGFDVKELAMDFSEEEKAIAGATHEDYTPWIDLHIRRELQWFNVLKHQMVNDPCALTGVVFDGVDKLQHLLWQYLDPSCEPKHPSEEFLRTREHCWDYFRQLDGFLKEIVELAGPQAYVVIVSDHGFTGTEEILYINTWLEQEGFLTWAPDAEVAPADSQELGDGKPIHLTSFDTTKTKAFASSASSNGIHIPVAGVRGDAGIAPNEYESFREELIHALLTRCVDPQTGEPIITNVWKREEIFAGPRMNLAPDLTVGLRDSGFFSVFRGDTVLKRRPVVMGCHHPEGVFLATGRGVRQGVRLAPLHLLDIAPTLLYAMGLAVPRDLEGAACVEAWVDEHVEAHPVTFNGSTMIPPHVQTAATEDAPYDEEGDAQVMMRLRALGYID